jgi:type I restriction enzyme S subunit
VSVDASVVKFQEAVANRDFRLDAEFWAHKPVRNENLDYVSIGDFILSSVYGTSKALNSEGVGVPTYRMNEIDDFLCDTSPEKHVAGDAIDSDLLLKPGDVLFNRTNSMEWVGRTGIYLHDDNVDRTFASYLVRFRPDRTVLSSESLVSFLGSREGKRELRRRARPSVNQANINPEEVKAVSMPLPRQEIQGLIGQIFAAGHRMEVRGQHAIADAFRAANWVGSSQPFEATVGVRSSETVRSTGRWDAEFNLASRLGVDSSTLISPDEEALALSELVSLVDGLFTPKRDELYRYVQLADIDFFGRIRHVPEVLGADLPSRARRVIHAGDVIVSSVEGSIDRCAIVPEKYDGAICSTGFYVLRSKEGLSGWLFALLRSDAMQSLLRVSATGSILSAYSAESLLSVVIGKTDLEARSAMHEAVMQGVRDRDRARVALIGCSAVFDVLIDRGEAEAYELARATLSGLAAR